MKKNQSGYAPSGLIKDVAPVEKKLLHGEPPPSDPPSFISSCRVEAMPACQVEQAPPCLSARGPKRKTPEIRRCSNVTCLHLMTSIAVVKSSEHGCWLLMAHSQMQTRLNPIIQSPRTNPLISIAHSQMQPRDHGNEREPLSLMTGHRQDRCN
jgi:hypothetical protein